MTIQQVKLQVTSELELDQVLQGVAQLDTSTLEQFLQEVGRLLAQRKAAHLPQREAELIERIASDLPPTLRARYQTLNTALHADRLSEAEHQEFLALVDQVEMADAARLQALIELAHLRGVSLDELMTQLNLRPSDHA